jgi:predicted nucleic acid-binding protein
MSVIANTTVLSNFAELGELEMLRRLYGEIHVSVEVYREVEAGLEEGYTFYAEIPRLVDPDSSESWIRLTSLTEKELLLLPSIPTRLHAGEASSLAIARSRGWLFLTDDKAARRYGSGCGIVLSGTLGCLISGIRRDLWTLARANECLAQIIEFGFFAPVADLADLLDRS